MTDLTPSQLRETAAKIAGSLVPSPGDRALADDLIAIADRIDRRNAPTSYCCNEPTNCGTTGGGFTIGEGCLETLKQPCPCQCNQQLVDIIGNLVAVLRERS